ncbi:hypothetical protein JNK13_09605 [bacterium]|nr:hypothetical protein [bacterium]
MSCDVELRKTFISWFKEQVNLARNAFSAWKSGNFQLKPPPGFFAPGGSLLASALLPLALA